MSNAQLRVKNLLNNIQQDYKRYTQLIVLLNDQRTFMIERRSDDLEQLNVEIEALYRSLNESTAERRDALKQLNIPASAEGMQTFLARLPAAFGDKAKALWRALEEQVTTCKQLNDHNANLLISQQEILNALLGHQPDLIYQR